jgi:hypothetical protein
MMFFDIAITDISILYNKHLMLSIKARLPRKTFKGMHFNPSVNYFNYNLADFSIKIIVALGVSIGCVFQVVECEPEVHLARMGQT